MENNNNVHRRLIRNSITLFQDLKELGFIKIESYYKSASNELHAFQNNNKFVYSSRNHGIRLLTKPKDITELKTYTKRGEVENGLIISFKGFSVHDEILKFFTSRELTKVEVK